ncbi:MAG: right-handed parallel beta-helix repeat-containing protein [Phycisphaerae bacterium]|nr:right-handed parallel beta-helix repeat-containing protein [Phycisphaerae bacterium]
MKPIFPLVIACTALAPSAEAKTVELTPKDDWFAVLSGPSLQPGDEIVLAAGTYTDRRRLAIGHRGSPRRPVTIRAATGARVVFKRPDARQNTINMEGCQFLVLKGIEITGGSAGIRISGKAGHRPRFITLENLHIHHVGGVAVTANHPGEIYESLTFRGNHIHHTGGHGEGFYLGSNNAADGSTNGYIFNSVVENNYIHHLTGSTVSQGDGIELKDGSYNNIVRDNVIHDTNYPGIIVYGTDGKAPNVLERNVIWNTGDNGIQAAADAVIRNNIIYDTRGDGLHCRNHQSAVVGRLKILHNTILSRSAIRIVAPKKLSGPVLVAGNAAGGSLRLPPVPGVKYVANLTGITELYPGAGSKCIGAAEPAYVPSDDFNAGPRGPSMDVGAYRYYAAGNRGWTIAPGFKARP